MIAWIGIKKTAEAVVVLATKGKGLNGLVWPHRLVVSRIHP